MSDAKKEAFQMSKAAGKKADEHLRKVKSLMKRAKEGEDVEPELGNAVKEMENHTPDLCAAFYALKKLPSPEGEPTDAI
jgi:hypothetical protein